MVYSEKQYAYYLELARIACSPSSFVGSDMRYSSEFEVLEAELGKAHSIHGAGLPDWQKISEISECILREHSKDLRVAAWLAWALYQRDSFAGLLAGLGVLRELCEHHWAQVYPVKLRTRIAAFGWLVSRLEQACAHNVPLEDQRPLCQALLEHLECLDRLWGEQLGSEAPLLLPVRRQLSARLAQATAEPGGVAGVIAQVKPARTALLEPEQPLNNEKDAHKRLRALQEQARPLRKPEPSSVVVDSVAQPWEAALQAVMPCLRKDGLKVAVGVLKQGLLAACGDRARFHWHLALARLCVAAGKHDLARIQLEQLDLQLQRTGLESWEPELRAVSGRCLIMACPTSMTCGSACMNP